VYKAFVFCKMLVSFPFTVHCKRKKSMNISTEYLG